MSAIAEKIMRRVRGKGRGKWVCTAKDFLDIGKRGAVDQALSRLARNGDLRRVGCGLYDLPRFSKIINCYAPVDIDSAIDAIVRRDNIQVMQGGGFYANYLGVTNNVAAKIIYVTDGVTRDIKIGGWTVYLRHASPKVMFWKGRPAEPVAQALRWLGPYSIQDPYVAGRLKQILPDYVKKDLIENIKHLPNWIASVVQEITEDYGEIA